MQLPESGSKRRTLYGCEADVLPGLERFARSELIELAGQGVKFTEAARDGQIRFHYTGDLRLLLDMRSILAIYLVQQFVVPRPQALLGHQHFTALCELIATARMLAPQEAYRTLRLSAAGEDSSIMQRLKGELAQSTGLDLAADEGDLLVRLRRAADRQGWEALVRISPRPLATRAWRVCNMPGAPNATLAHCMMCLSQPHADDEILNLACGSGTLLVERLALGPARSLIGCDTNPAALTCARANLHAAGYDHLVRLDRWDAAATPLPDGSVSTICADLPFGQLVGSHRENEALYPQLLAEATRVAAPQARMVLLTHEMRLLERAAARYLQQWQLVEALRVRSGGMTPQIYVFHRSDDAYLRA